MASPPIFDPKVLLKRLGGNRNLFDELIEIFREEAPRNLEAIRDGIANADPEAVKLGSHTLKGSLSYFETAPAIELAEHLEKKANAKNLEGASEAYSRLTALVQPLLEELARIGSKTPSQPGEKRS